MEPNSLHAKQNVLINKKTAGRPAKVSKSTGFHINNERFFRCIEELHECGACDPSKWSLKKEWTELFLRYHKIKKNKIGKQSTSLQRLFQKAWKTEQSIWWENIHNIESNVHREVTSDYSDEENTQIYNSGVNKDANRTNADKDTTYDISIEEKIQNVEGIADKENIRESSDGADKEKIHDCSDGENMSNVKSYVDKATNNSNADKDATYDISIEENTQNVESIADKENICEFSDGDDEEQIQDYCDYQNMSLDDCSDGENMSIDLSRIPLWNWGQSWFPNSVHLTKASKVWIDVFNPKSCVVLDNNYLWE